MAVYEINEAQNNANKVNTNKDLVAGYASQQVEETLQKEATKAVEKTSKALLVFSTALVASFCKVSSTC